MLVIPWDMLTVKKKEICVSLILEDLFLKGIPKWTNGQIDQPKTSQRSHSCWEDSCLEPHKYEKKKQEAAGRWRGKAVM